MRRVLLGPFLCLCLHPGSQASSSLTGWSRRRVAGCASSRCSGVGGGCKSAGEFRENTSPRRGLDWARGRRPPWTGCGVRRGWGVPAWLPEPGVRSPSAGSPEAFSAAGSGSSRCSRLLRAGQPCPGAVPPCAGSLDACGSGHHTCSRPGEGAAKLRVLQRLLGWPSC